MTALGALVLFVLSVWWAKLGSLGWIGVAFFVAAFVALVVVHARIIRRKDMAAAGVRYHELGLLRVNGEHSKLPVRGEGLAKETHPYAIDLDLFGQGSLLQLVDATQTQLGETKLVGWLDGSDRASFDDLHARQDAVRDLASRPELRERLSVLGTVAMEHGKPDPTPMIRWSESSESLAGPLGRLFIRIWPFVIVASIVAAKLFPIPTSVPWAAYLVAFVYALATRNRSQQVSAAVTQNEGGVRAFVDLVALVEHERFEAPRLKALGSRLSGATAELRRLGTIVGWLESRSNEVFRLFLSPFLLVEQNCVLWLESWRKDSGKKMRGWFEVLGEVEALASLAQLGFDNPDYAYPELADSPTFDATDLGHPLIPADRRRGNDVAFSAPGHALIVTGSNMSGKSTLLRAAGVAVVLGLAGAPVCAKKLRLGPVRLATSMRISDSLETGTSRFYAELKRLKSIVGMSAEGPGVFFLLDEVLHGTNTRERLIGARAVIKSLLARGALGAVSTHDLAIGDLEREMPGKVANVHFEEQVEGEVMTFDYKLRQGVVQSSNALRLMKAVGLEVE